MPRRIAKQHRAECIRLRTAEQLSTPEIARRVGLSNHSVYRILRKHPWLPKWAAMRGGLRAVWSPEEVAVLKKLYPSADEPEILAALPARKWPSISKKAGALGLRRPLPGTRKNARFVHPIFAQLRKAREQRGYSRPSLGEKSGIHYNQLLYWELGQSMPHFHSLVAWAETLGFEVVLRPKLGTVERSELAAPDRARLMAGR